MDHKNWMKSRLKSFKQITLVAESSDSVIGTAYLSGLVNGMAEVSIRVEKASSGHGVGKLLLQKQKIWTFQCFMLGFIKIILIQSDFLRMLTSI